MLSPRSRSAISFATGVVLTLGYWYSVHPAGFARGYVGDICIVDQTRQIMAEQLERKGHPSFETDALLAPKGGPIPFQGWSIERDWLGSYFWRWDRDFPFQWAYYGFSLLVAFVGVGLILGRMGLGPEARWLVSVAVTLFHVPRHMKAWFHYELMLQHWVYLGIFLDAWLWRRLTRERTWSWRIELWRGVALLGVFGTAGYFWAFSILEWLLVRGCALWLFWDSRKRQGARLKPESFPRGARPMLRAVALPVTIGAGLFILDLRWFLPLWVAVRKTGPVVSNLGWFANMGYVFRPLWLDFVWGPLQRVFAFLPNLRPLNTPETVVTVGWFYWIPFGVALMLIRKRSGGPGTRVILPFLLLIITGIVYACLEAPPFLFQRLIQAVVPFMSFFRVTSRWGLFLPQLLTACIVLAWPELSGAVSRGLRGPRRLATGAWVGAYAVLSLAEMIWLVLPTVSMPSMPANAAALLELVRERPGDTVLDLPFCMAGGNGVCTSEQCPQFPDSTIGACLRQWHDKKVYGLYSGRLNPRNCEIYEGPPFSTWFSAWRQERCFTEPEWNQFCGYLSAHGEISSVLLYPDIWTGAGSPECLSSFERHLGHPLGQASVYLDATRGGKPGDRLGRIIAYEARCLPGSPAASSAGPTPTRLSPAASR